MKKKIGRAPEIGTVRDERQRGILSRICGWWDSDPKVSLVVWAMCDDEDRVGVNVQSMIDTKAHHGVEIIYQLAKQVRCNCGKPECHITRTAEAVVAVIELQMVSARGEKVALH
jgi:hypothetical protein